MLFRSYLQQHGEATRRSDKSLRVYWRIFVKIFVSATEFCYRNMSQVIKSDGIYATCSSDKILLQRQRFSQKFSSTKEPICRCHVSLACIASVSVWKDRGTGLSVLAAREVERNYIFARKRWLRRLSGDATCCCNYSPRDLARVKKRYKSKLCPKT